MITLICPARELLAGIVLLSIACSFSAVDSIHAEETTLKVWPGKPPGIVFVDGEERDTSGEKGAKVQGKTVIRLGHVAEPTITVFPPPEEKNTGAAVLVCPGGGYHILAYDLEGTEVCEWLNSIGVTGVLLKYRVPRPPAASLPEGQKGERPIGPLMDAQRALSLVRSKAKEWSINPDRIGVLGFSAGGHLAARLATNYQKPIYLKDENKGGHATDEVDKVSCRPNFAVLIYPAYLHRESDELLSPDFPVDKNTPPMFLTMAFDDRVGPENILRMGIALKRKDVPAEVHLFPTGGHGYGLRPSEHKATTWPKLCGDWMEANGWLDDK